LTLFREKYRIESSRLKGWDYSSEGLYYITICTKNREEIFGQIINDEMVLNDFGEITDIEWNKSFEIRKELQCDCYIIMPDHIHAIVFVSDINPVETHGVRLSDGGGGGDACHASLRNTPCRMPKSVSSFIGGFKSVVTKIFNEINNTSGIPVWQPRFYDRIIRNEKELNRIRQYIKNNPKNWKNDRNAVMNLHNETVETHGVRLNCDNDGVCVKKRKVAEERKN
jgi:putative transposase